MSDLGPSSCDRGGLTVKGANGWMDGGPFNNSRSRKVENF